MKKLLSVVLTCVMLCTLLTGCVYEDVDTTIHADGSGTIKMMVGVSQELMQNALQDETDGADGVAFVSEEEAETFEIDGTTYYGTTEEASFASVEEFNALFAGFSETGSSVLGMESPLGGVVILEKSGGGLTLSFDNRPQEISFEEPEGFEEFEEEPIPELTEEQIAARTQAFYEAFRGKATGGLSSADLREAAAYLAADSYYDTDEEFADYIAEGLSWMSVEAMNSYIWNALDNARNYSSSPEPLTEEQIAARRAEIEAALNGLAIELTDEEKSFYAEAMSDWYDEYYTDREFAEEMARLRAMDEETLREELSFFDSSYGGSSFDDMDLEALTEGMVLRFTFRFDAPLTQIAGPADGAGIEGGTLTLNLLEMAQEMYRFTTRTDVELAYEHGQSVEVDGVPVDLTCYATRSNGYETNYIRIRELAAALSGTPARFDVGWNKAVEILSGAAYSSDDSGFAMPFSGNRPYRRGSFETRIDGRPVALDAIMLNDEDGGGYTYYKLRDVGEALNFNVRWDAARRTICIETDKPYSPAD